MVESVFAHAYPAAAVKAWHSRWVQLLRVKHATRHTSG